MKEEIFQVWALSGLYGFFFFEVLEKIDLSVMTAVNMASYQKCMLLYVSLCVMVCLDLQADRNNEILLAYLKHLMIAVIGNIELPWRLFVAALMHKCCFLWRVYLRESF